MLRTIPAPLGNEATLGPGKGLQGALGNIDAKGLDFTERVWYTAMVIETKDGD